ncbi:MAG: acylphosphatase [Candidatus Margulisbacteria bacterium]|nr:acylphosphatase [Candidatus Margulisiibacteriota bacterium]
MKRAHIYYSGFVQGVGFRFTAADLAFRNKILGQVKNLADGRVELVAEAEESDLKRFLAEIETALSSAIRQKNLSWEPATGQFTDFQISY